MTSFRTRRVEACAVACVLGWGAFACKTVDPGLLDARDAGARDAGRDAALMPPDGEMPMPDAGRDTGADSTNCAPKEEKCNGKDDDCDDKVDEGGDAWCAENVIEHADAVCEKEGSSASCFWLGDCHEGYWSCDGDPANGCEADFCACNECDDGGMDDGGT